MGVRGPGAVSIQARRRATPLKRLPPAPSTLSADAAHAWRACGKRAIALGTISEVDLDGLALLARTLGTVAECEEVLRTEGLIVTSGAVKKAHPAAALLAQSRSQARALLSDFGLLPAGREKLKGGGPPQPCFDPADRYLDPPTKPWNRPHRPAKGN